MKYIREGSLDNNTFTLGQSSKNFDLQGRKVEKSKSRSTSTSTSTFFFEVEKSKSRKVKKVEIFFGEKDECFSKKV